MKKHEEFRAGPFKHLLAKGEYYEAFLTVYRYIQDCAPKDTGNLRYNAAKIEMLSDTSARIYIDDAIAPYMPYTNEPWVADRWKGKRNPNLFWFDSAVASVMSELGKIKSKSPSGDVDVERLAREYNVLPEDIYINSKYIVDSGDPYSSFDNARGYIGGEQE